jgi:hypothetical protein
MRGFFTPLRMTNVFGTYKEDYLGGTLAVDAEAVFPSVV